MPVHLTNKQVDGWFTTCISKWVDVLAETSRFSRLVREKTNRTASFYNSTFCSSKQAYYIWCRVCLRHRQEPIIQDRTAPEGWLKPRSSPEVRIDCWLMRSDLFLDDSSGAKPVTMFILERLGKDRTSRY
ncbi:hypothetical protein R1flu_026987 [Riccia fluitans]|uniref:Uncharacterized protein n=1 Tax=Riccia fluitans TaxID=41844 RepID=A0ABD1XI36_9MARC